MLDILPVPRVTISFQSTEGIDKMDEATFEARLHAELKRLFPTIAETRITHQEIFTLQLGRQTISVNGKAQFAAKGRLDVLVEKTIGHP